jgi:hypothetical protein
MKMMANRRIHLLIKYIMSDTQTNKNQINIELDENCRRNLF